MSPRDRGYLGLLQKISAKTGTPISNLAVSFAILHEVTAIVPFVGIWYTARVFNVGNKMTTYWKRDESPEDDIVSNYLRRTVKQGEGFVAPDKWQFASQSQPARRERNIEEIKSA